MSTHLTRMAMGLGMEETVVMKETVVMIMTRESETALPPNPQCAHAQDSENPLSPECAGDGRSTGSRSCGT